VQCASGACMHASLSGFVQELKVEVEVVETGLVAARKTNSTEESLGHGDDT